ncbi:MAG: hypothetical protein LKJ03_03705 [Enterococcaceae bacterium]|jgi:hypothetical protein|nr:hypothetical protein [Enterococcaceae bacterium]MCI1918944.1 hypothetical protein [Enterococcaceae bacterium]
MKTKYKWLLFWGAFLGMMLLGGIMLLTEHFPQVKIPFETIVPPEKVKKVPELKQPAALTLPKDDDVLLTKAAQDTEALFQSLKSLSLDEIVKEAELKNGFAQVYAVPIGFDWRPLVRNLMEASQAEAPQFLGIRLIGCGEELIDGKTVEILRQEWLFRDGSNEYFVFPVKLTHDGERWSSLTAGAAAHQEYTTAALSPDDPFLDQHADFVSELNEWKRDFTAGELYDDLSKQSKKEGLQSLKKHFSLPKVLSADTFYPLFMASEGELKYWTITGFELINTPKEGRTMYQVSIPQRGKDPRVFQLTFDRLDGRIEHVE